MIIDPITGGMAALSALQSLGLLGGSGGPSAPAAPSGGIQMERSKIADAQVKANLQEDAVTQGTSMLKGVKAGKLDDSLQMAALAAQLGSVLFPGGQAPPPPGLPRGGGMGIKPVFQNTARGLYGG